MTISRRAFGFALLGTSALAACTGKTTDQLHQDVMLISSGLASLAQTLQAIPQVPPAVLAQANATIADIQAHADEIASTLTPGATMLQAISNSVNTLAALLTPYFPMSPAMAAVIQAALSLVPVVLASAGVAAAPPKGAMAPDAARVVLRSAAAK